METKKKIVIIGGGFSGTMTAINLLRSDKSLRITLFDQSQRPARGIAYSASSAVLLLNVPAARMSPFADAPSDFLEWAQKNTDHPLVKGHTISPDAFLPRGFYGAYLSDLLSSATSQSKGSTVEIVNRAVTSLSKRGAVWTATGDFAEARTADAVVLAVGNPSSTVIPALKNISADRKVDPWASMDLGSRHFGDSVICFGSGLTAIDAVLRLQELQYDGTIHLCSRHGLLPLDHHCEPLLTPLSKLDIQPGALREVLRNLRAQIKAGVQAGMPWQIALDTLRPSNQSLWAEFTQKERARFLRHLLTYWEIHRHRIAPEISDKLKALRARGKVIVHAGLVEHAMESADGVHLRLRKRHTQRYETVNGSHVFLCAGPAWSISSWMSPMLEELVTKKMIIPDPLGLGFTTRDDAEREGLYLIGPPLRGKLFETTAAKELSQQAAAVAEKICADVID